MNDGTNNIVNIIKKVVKRYGIVIVKTVLPIVLIIVLLASFIYFLDIDATAYKDGDWTNTPYAASQYTSNVTMSDSGKLTSSMTAQELWDKMKEEGNDIAKFLKGPEELLKLKKRSFTAN